LRWLCVQIFRSQDYNALLFAFKQLFEKVEVTMPVASRATSAEIYVICQKYRAPAKIDPRLLDAKHLFKETIEAPKVCLSCPFVNSLPRISLRICRYIHMLMVESTAACFWFGPLQLYAIRVFYWFRSGVFGEFFPFSGSDSADDVSVR
jgi:hypothetical protein